MPPRPRATDGATRARAPRGGRRRSRRAAQAKRPPRLPGAAPLELLPSTLFHLVMSFCLSGRRPFVWNDRSEAEDELEELAFVSKAFRLHALEISGQLALGKLCVNVGEYWTRAKLVQTRQRVMQRRAYLREIKIHAVAPQGASTREWRLKIDREVATIVSLATNLEMLDLRSFEGDTKEVVDVAARSCPKLKVLLFRSYVEDGVWDVTNPLVEALYAGMEQWHKSNGGLLQLRLPDRQSEDKFKNSTNFVEQVVRYCPNIELIDGSYMHEPDPPQSRDRWIINRTTWADFCATCTNLREFDWISVPWSTDFFEIFGSHMKPLLTSLTLRTSMEWNWDWYFEDIGREEAAVIRRHGFGATAQNLSRVLSACPSLKRLWIIANSDVDDSASTLEAIDDMDPLDRPDIDPPHFKPENRLSTEVVGDSFCKALVRCCPLLEEFSVTEDYASLASCLGSDAPNARFRDSALYTLGKLERLTQLKLPKVEVSGKAIFDVVNMKANQAHSTQCYCLTLGHETDEDQKRFYNAIQKLLQSMLDPKQTQRIPSKRVYVEIKNGNDIDVEHEWCVGYFKRFKAALKGVRRKNPSLTFRVEVEGLHDDFFDRIVSFGFYTAKATVPDDSPWSAVPEYALEDDVFVLAEALDDEDHEYDDDYDDEFGDDWGGGWDGDWNGGWGDDYNSDDGDENFGEEDEYYYGGHGWD